MTKTILLTGATGFLGSHLLKKFLDNSFNVVILKRSFSNVDRIKKYLSKIKTYDIDKIELATVFEENKIDVVVHTATNYGRNSSITELLNSNLMFPIKLLECATQQKISYFINTDTALNRDVNLYALSKKQFSEWAKQFFNTIKYVNLRLEQFYGANDTKFPNFVINSLLKNEKELNLTKGEQQRCFVYIDDVVNAYITILEKIESIESGTSFDIASDEIITIKDFVKKCQQLTSNISTKLNFGVVPYRINESMFLDIDIVPIKSLGWQCEYDLETGLKKVISEECIK